MSTICRDCYEGRHCDGHGLALTGYMAPARTSTGHTQMMPETRPCACECGDDQ